MSQSTYTEEIADLLRQAEETFRGGDPESARMIFEAVLQIDPDNDAALAGIERAAPAPPEPVAGGFDLRLDFEQAAAAPAPARRPSAPPPPAAAPPRPAPQPEAIVDLLEAAELLPEEEREPFGGEGPQPAATGAPEREAAKLAQQARRHLFQGDLARATEMASRALAMHEGCDGAQDVLEEARAEASRRAATAEHLLSDAISAIERGSASQAIPMLQQVLGLAPEHPEALEWLARARQSIQEGRHPHGAAPAASPTPGFTPTSLAPPRPAPTGPVAGPTAAPTATPTPAEPGAAARHEMGFQSNATPDPTTGPIAAPGSAGRYAAGVARERAPVDTPLAVTAATKPPRAPIAVAGTAAGDTAAAEPTAPEPPVIPPPPVPRPANAPAAARPLRGKAAKVAKAGRGRRLLLPLAALAVLTLLGGGGWWMGDALGWWGSDAGSAQAADDPAKARPRKPAPAPAAPRLTKADVPRLLVEAKLAVARGDEKTGFALIRQAAQLDPAHAEAKTLAAKVEHATASRAEADDRHSQLVRSHGEHDFASVLRILYRLPKDEQPADFNRAIANASFNLGLQMMRGGDPYGAREYLKDALERRPGDAETKRLLELAKQYRNRERDDVYFKALAEMQFRPLE
ncbi:MAG: hypothetical protein MUF27_07085 [Acidobacteria bacterium]|nr:hypothetical protein [Acidobacteriota bacterium]